MRSTRSGMTMALAIGAFAAPAALAQVGGPAQADDIAFGLSQGDPTLTAQLVRGGALQGNWTFQNFLQSVEFDNLGSSHNARGNLLALNFGSTGSGGSLWSLATNGTDTGSMIYAFDGTNEGMTRVAGLSISPDNTKAAVYGYDTGSLLVLDYGAGDGSGNGSIAGTTEVAAIGITGSTQGTTWLDDDTVVAALLGVTPGDLDVVTYEVSSGTTTVVTTLTGLQSGSEVTDIDYNTLVSPYVFISHSSFSGGTENIVTVLDPADWTVIDDVALNNSANTLREIALGFDANDVGTLYLSMFGGTIDALDLTGVGALVDDSSTDFYDSGVSASFNGMDYALTEIAAGPNSVAITEFINNPFGDEGGREWIEVYNFGTEEVDLNGWTLSDEDSDTWAIATSIVVAPDDFVILVAGVDTIPPADKKAIFESEWLDGNADPRVHGIDASFFLSNSGDEVILTDPLGTEAWHAAWDNDEFEGESTYLSSDDYSINVFGSKDAPGIVRLGFDNGSDDFYGYETQSSTNTTDINAYVANNGDLGSPLFLSTGEDPFCVMLDASDFIAGTVATVDLSRGTPGEVSLLVWGLEPGTTQFDSLRLGLCATFGIKGVKSKARYLGVRVFDAAGNAQYELPVPNRDGTTVLFQAAEFNTCPDECVSNVIERTIQSQ